MHNKKEGDKMDIERIYEAYDSTILEEFRKQKEYIKADMMRNDFYRYLKQQYPDFDKKEFTNAKTKEDAKAVADKYQDDFQRFIKQQPKKFIPSAIRWGLIAADFTGLLPKDVTNKMYKIMLADDIQYYGRELSKGF